MIKNLTDFFKCLDKELKEFDITLKEEWFIDHICYRTSSLDNYKDICDDYLRRNTLLVEGNVGGRLISTFKLKEPIKYQDRLIPLVEVPQPKRDSTPEGYEHIEVVVSESFEQIKSLFPQGNFKSHALKKDINPELVLKLDKCVIKFHHQSLEDVIKYEKKMGLV